MKKLKEKDFLNRGKVIKALEAVGGYDQEIAAKYLANFQPKWWKFPWKNIYDMREFGLEVEKNQKEIEENFLEWVKTYPSPKQEFKEWIDELLDGEGKINRIGKFYSGKNRLIKVQVGTSLHRAQAFVAYGGGVVKGEWIWNHGSPYGLQVSTLNECRSSIRRTWYYTHHNAIPASSERCILVFEIPEKYLMCQKNKGEYFVPQRFWRYIQNPEYFLNTWDLKERYPELED